MSHSGSFRRCLESIDWHCEVQGLNDIGLICQAVILAPLIGTHLRTDGTRKILSTSKMVEFLYPYRSYLQKGKKIILIHQKKAWAKSQERSDPKSKGHC